MDKFIRHFAGTECDQSEVTIPDLGFSIRDGLLSFNRVGFNDVDDVDTSDFDDDDLTNYDYVKNETEQKIGELLDNGVSESSNTPSGEASVESEVKEVH